MKPYLHRGLILKLLPHDHGRQVTVALLERASPNGWNCMVVGGSSEIYKPGGWDIFVFDSDLAEAEVIKL